MRCCFCNEVLFVLDSIFVTGIDNLRQRTVFGAGSNAFSTFLSEPVLVILIKLRLLQTLQHEYLFKKQPQPIKTQLSTHSTLRLDDVTLYPKAFQCPLTRSSSNTVIRVRPIKSS